MDDPFTLVEFFTPNPTRITEKGHILTKTHDSQDLRKLDSLINAQLIARIIRN